MTLCNLWRAIEHHTLVTHHSIHLWGSIFHLTFLFSFDHIKKKNLGHKVQTHMWQIVLCQQFSYVIRGRGLRNKSQKEKISGSIWRRKKKGVKRSWCRVWKHQQLFCHSWHTVPLLSIQIHTNFSLRTFWYKLDARKNHLTSTIHTKNARFQLSEDVTNLCSLIIWGSKDTCGGFIK